MFYTRRLPGRNVNYWMLPVVTTIVPGVTPCLLCLFPESPTARKRQFPILAPVSAMAGAIAAAEGIKLLTGIGQTLQGTLLYFDAGGMALRRIEIKRRPDCKVCGQLGRG